MGGRLSLTSVITDVPTGGTTSPSGMIRADRVPIGHSESATYLATARSE